MIHRNITEQILQDLSFFPIVSIIGPRQCGKTTLVKSLKLEPEKETLYLDLEWEADRVKLDDAGTYLAQRADKCIILDEVQLMPKLFPLLRALVDQKRVPARFILLGSASPELLKISSESLAGRIAYHELTPFALTEVYTKSDDLLLHFLRGGFPDAFLAPTDVLSARWLNQFTSTFVERDLVNIIGKEINPRMMMRFIRMLSHVHGQIMNYSDLSNSLDISIQTVVKYTDLLESAFVIRRLEPFHINIGKRLTKSPKLYFRDSGFFHAISRIDHFETLYAHPAYGASWEGYVLEQIYRVAQGNFEYFFYRTSGGAEVDLVLVTPQQTRICIEIKTSNSPNISKGFFTSISDLKADHAYVITQSNERYARADGVIVIGLFDFLKEMTQFL
jgi:uncharacterized protein